jgi:transposase
VRNQLDSIKSQGRARKLSTKPNSAISRGEIHAAYEQGEDAVVVLIESLIARIEALESQRSKNSQNSSKPPSSDGFGKRTKSLRKKSERSSGGQLGHPGSTLEWQAEPNWVETHSVGDCEGCGMSLTQEPVQDWVLRQVHDLAPAVLEATEHQSEIKCCWKCGVVNIGKFPHEVSNPIQYGPRIQSMMVYAMESQLLPSARVCELLKEVFGVDVSEGTLYNARQRCFEALEVVEQEIRESVTKAEVVHFDETGFRVKSKLWWLHVACTDGLTFYFVHEKRGQIAMDEMKVLPEFEGIGMHDGLKSYGQYEFIHSLCNAHHLRELSFIGERYGQTWAEEMLALLVEMKRQVDTAKELRETRLGAAQLQSLEMEYERILKLGFEDNSPEVTSDGQPKRRGRPKQSPAKNLLDRLDVGKEEVLRFIHDFKAPFDNNQAERDLRMMKLKQKISGGFRSEEGARMFCRIRGYLSTLRKQGNNVIDALVRLFMGNLASPISVAE